MIQSKRNCFRNSETKRVLPFVNNVNQCFLMQTFGNNLFEILKKIQSIQKEN